MEGTLFIEPIRNVFVNNFKAIGKLAWHLAGAPGTSCVEHTPEGKKEIKASPFVPGPPLCFCA
jgi:hypothetical protein